GRATLPRSGPRPEIHADATYLIAGGLGGLGALTARWLAAAGARHLVLISRRGPEPSPTVDLESPATREQHTPTVDLASPATREHHPPAVDLASPAAREQHATLTTLRAAGVTLELAAVDITDEHALAALLRDLAPRTPPLRGVFHAAGVLADGLLLRQDAARFRDVFAAKLRGAWNLHTLTRDAPLDHFVLYSSFSVLFGAPGLGNYVAANSFLDALALHRRHLGLPALAIDWGLFAGVGVGRTADRDGRGSERGFGSLGPDDGAAVLRRLLAADLPRIGAAPFDPRRWLEFHPQAARLPRFTALLDEARQTRQAPGKPEPGRAQALRDAAPGERHALVASFTREQVAAVLRLDPADLDPRAPLRSLGIDSLMGLEVRNRLEAGLGLTLSATLLWTYPTVAALADFLAKRIAPAPAPAPLAPPPPPPPAPPSPTESDDDLLAAFDASFAKPREDAP
ncbi:MAG: KR domain-containing protein, partial [Myxococcales bacterium]|nr:KR domain-containing protein [Myxococcales bacterium]